MIKEIIVLFIVFVCFALFQCFVFLVITLLDKSFVTIISILLVGDMDLIQWHPPKTKLHVKALMSNVMVFGNGAFERRLGLDEVMKMGPSQWN